MKKHCLIQYITMKIVSYSFVENELKEHHCLLLKNYVFLYKLQYSHLVIDHLFCYISYSFTTFKHVQHLQLLSTRVKPTSKVYKP